MFSNIAPTFIFHIVYVFNYVCIRTKESVSDDLVQIIKYNPFIDFVCDKMKASMDQNKREEILDPVLMKNKTLSLENNLQNVLKVFLCR